MLEVTLVVDGKSGSRCQITTSETSINLTTLKKNRILQRILTNGLSNMG